MNKSELIAKIATKADLPQKQAAAALTAFETIIGEALKAGENVQVTGFGTFEIRTRAARQSRNPQTGEIIEVAAKKVPAFKPGKGLKEAVH